jgi:group I intron endonuclease
MIIYSIYKAVNKINGKCYIGFDSNWPNRKKRHLKDSFSENSRAYNDVFHKAIRKYGRENFEWEVIYQSKDGAYCKNIMENFFVLQFNSFINSENSVGYNMTLGGEGMLGFKHSEESKLKNSKSCSKQYKFWNIDGTFLQFRNLKQYCIASGLSKDLLGSINSGKSLSYRGYIKYYENKTFEECLQIYHDKKKKSMEIMGEKHAKSWKIECPDKTIIDVFNLSNFCDSRGLNHRSLRHLKSLKGYRIL